MTIDEYKLTFDNPELWFLEEINKSFHIQRIAKVFENKLYLSGKHAILQRENGKYKGSELITSKIVLNKMNSILNFHKNYLLGESVTLTGDDDLVEALNSVYRTGLYSDTDSRILDKVLKFGDAYEYVYYADGVIKSKVIDSANAYPVYDDFGNYLAFIENWTDAYSNISYYNVFHDTYIESWSNEGGELKKVDSKANVSGLPIHFHNYNDMWETFGSSMIDEVKGLIDELESMYSKISDSLYINSLNPINVMSGQVFKGTVSDELANAMVLSLDSGSEFKVVNTMLDSQTISLYLNEIKSTLNEIASIPSVLGNSNIANVSEVSLKLLLTSADLRAKDNESFMRKGLYERIKQIKNILKLQGTDYGNATINFCFNYSRPIVLSEIIDNLSKMRDMGAISVKSIIQKSQITTDLEDELDRLAEEQNANNEM